MEHGFSVREVARIRANVEEHREVLLKAWHDFFSD
jgi:hypothetical protein